ncbi:sigma-70 family RNA polymerase sigma factor [Aliifodinibius sp. S!AR15-10]|uniref:sigma-70 family RNA polymerase sigma factor n=1 Tax=Aliifodinibius sp. S!AR15-10 TaxID=2950437 RepID=UPI002859FF41|nr:sigma-70 family RNA polymerase sigma factor [Aliifodinibius sp. S!AR15-10]MDR8391774.1 sigma-70 family RNA polymerase sigma factor [Aliifodinibius sp. S!AR15-10]
MKTKSEVTKLLIEVRQGSKEAYEQLFPIVYDELKRIAYSNLQQERNDITLTETALVHEVYLKMVDQTKVKAENRNHFMAIAARCMRQILVDHARKKKAEKRGGDQQDITFIDGLLKVHQQSMEVIDLDNKLKELSKIDERLAEVVTLRFFGQMTVYATAEALGVSERTVKRDWAKARGWLYKELKKSE